LLFVVFVFAFLYHMSFANNLPVLPAESSITEIIMIRNAWMVTFQSDGSAIIAYGSNSGDEAYVTKGSFPIKEIYRRLVPHVVPRDWDPKSVQVIFRSDQAASGVTVSLKDKAVIRKIFSELKKKANSKTKGRFGELSKKHSLPGEEDEQPTVSGPDNGKLLIK